ncbi:MULTISPECIES: cation transporter [Niallia]|uniref:Cation transporter n=2 Tax=Bacillales TaxID=1385 RepID=A0ABV1F142_9BACI|nr:cation transporter [Niallia sp. MER TA 168]MCM3364396.1 cation transporter [Niallia sp. MER TA 168]
MFSIDKVINHLKEKEINVKKVLSRSELMKWLIGSVQNENNQLEKRRTVMNQVILNVQGMTCEHCINLIEGKIGKLDGIESIYVLPNEGKINITFDLHEVDLKDITDSIEDQCFNVEGWEIPKPNFS